MPNPANDRLAKEPVEPVDEWITKRFLAYSEEARDPLVAAVLVLTEAIRLIDSNRKASEHLASAMDLLRQFRSESSDSAHRPTE